MLIELRKSVRCAVKFNPARDSMGYAVRNDGLGWRAINVPDDDGPNEYFSETEPVPRSTTAQIESAKISLVLPE